MEGHDAGFHPLCESLRDSHIPTVSSGMSMNKSTDRGVRKWLHPESRPIRTLQFQFAVWRRVEDLQIRHQGMSRRNAARSLQCKLPPIPSQNTIPSSSPGALSVPVPRTTGFCRTPPDSVGVVHRILIDRPILSAVTGPSRHLRGRVRPPNQRALHDR